MEEIRQKKIRRLLCALLPATLAIVVLGWILLERHVEEDYAGNGFDISLDSGFYGEDQELKIDMPRGTTVYYTDNCELPDREHGIRYTAPVSIAASGREKVHVYRFKAYYEDGRESEVLTRTYFMGKDIGGRYTTNVLHITGEPEGLFGYESGIFETGKIFDEFLKENPGVHYGSGVDANFTQRGREWEREVYIQYFDSEGKELLAQNGGIRINGNMTRMKNQKSFRLYARKEYDSRNKFEYSFLKNLVSEADGAVAQKYKRLLVRSGGNDNGFAFLRSELACALAADAGFPDVMHAEPVTVYINGAYQGIYWLENGYDDQYFENRYGEYGGGFVVLEGSDRQKTDSEEDTEQKYVDAFNENYLKYSAMDLTVEENYRELQQFLDVENYLQYFAIENYVGNLDWPDNNLRVYRYISAEDNYKEGSVFDGRYRHLLYDLDYSFGLLVLNDTVGILPERYTLDRILGEESPLFAALMEREDCRHYFINYNCDLINGAMSYENVAETLLQMASSREEELQYMLEETSLLEEEELWFWESATGSYDTVKLNYSRILEFAEKRPATVLGDLSSHFDCAMEDAYTLYLHWGGEYYSTAQVNSIHVDREEFSGIYFAGVPVVLKPCLAENERFVHWIVNGDVREEEELQLGDFDVKDQAIHVELVVEEAEAPVLQISAVRAKGTGDFIELINLSHQSVSTLGYFLSDGEDLYKYALPAMTMQPGETKRFYGKDCMDLEGLGEIGLNFNLKKGETVTLTYGEQTVKSLVIPDLSEEGIYRLDIATGKFREER